MSLRQRLGNFLLLVGLFCFFLFATDIAHDYRIENFNPFWAGILAFVLGAWMRFSKSDRPEAAAPPPKPAAPPPKPAAAPVAKKPGPLTAMLNRGKKPAGGEKKK
jgi:hypothetical protein